MANENRPDRLPFWATDVAANVVDPGTAKQEDGWINGEAPGAGNWNYMQNLVGQWVDYFDTISRPSLHTAMQNLKRTLDTPWETASIEQIKLQWLPGLQRFYMAMEISGAGALYAWDSADGITWSARKTVEGAAADCSQWVEKDGNLYIAVDEKILESSTGLVTDLTNISASTTVETASGLTWDPINELWIIVGNTIGVDGDAGYATAANFPIFTPTTFPVGDAGTLAHDPTRGVTVVGRTDDIGLFYSTDGVNWSSGVGTGGTSDGVFYNAALDAFVIKNLLGDPDNPSTGWGNASLMTEADHLVSISTQEGVIMVMSINATMRNVAASPNTQMDEFQGGAVFAITGVAPDDMSQATTNYLGNIQGGSSPTSDEMIDVNTKDFIDLGNRTLVWPRDGYKLAYSKY